VEELVMVKVVNIADMAAEVVLLEYNDIEVRNRTDGES
jgi:translation initiation factor 2 alpha subunit (eIF-2alpha)